MEEEVWKDIYFCDNGIIYDYRGLYQVSNKGNVKSLERDSWNGGAFFLKKERILKARLRNKKYLFVSLCKDCKPKDFAIHRLVAFMFVENDDCVNKKHINHKDENPSNNCAENLEWCTQKYNNNYGNHNKKISQSHKGKKLSEEHKNKIKKRLVCRYDINGKLLDILFQSDYGKMGFNVGNIGSCCKWYDLGENKNDWFATYKFNPIKSVGLNGEKFIFKYYRGE